MRTLLVGYLPHLAVACLTASQSQPWMDLAGIEPASCYYKSALIAKCRRFVTVDPLQAQVIFRNLYHLDFVKSLCF